MQVFQALVFESTAFSHEIDTVILPCKWRALDSWSPRADLKGSFSFVLFLLSGICQYPVLCSKEQNYLAVYDDSSMHSGPRIGVLNGHIVKCTKISTNKLTIIFILVITMADVHDCLPATKSLAEYPLYFPFFLLT